jgi:hypothetical protein
MPRGWHLAALVHELQCMLCHFSVLNRMCRMGINSDLVTCQTMDTEPESSLHSKHHSFHVYISGLLWAVVLAIVFGTVFSSLCQAHLLLSLAIVSVSAFIAIFIVYLGKLFLVNQQFTVALVWCILSMSLIFFAIGPDPVKPQPLETSTPASVIIPEALQGVCFSGFRRSLDGRQEFIIITITEVIRDPTRIVFRYSLNKGTHLTRGQGMVYQETSTISFRDGTRFKYTREDNTLTLRAYGQDYALYQHSLQ